MYSEDHFSEEGSQEKEEVFQVKFQVHGKVKSARAESRISEQISSKQKLCKFVVHLVTSNQRF